MASSKFILPKNCEICGKQFNAKTIYSKYCSQKCSEAGARKKKSLQKQEVKRQVLTAQIPVDRPYITIAEAVLLFGISRDTIYRQIRKGNIPAVNLGERLTRISRVHIEAMFPTVELTKAVQPETVNTKLDYNQDECYTVGEITEKFGISASTVSKTIRKKNMTTQIYIQKRRLNLQFRTNANK